MTHLSNSQMSDDARRGRFFLNLLLGKPADRFDTVVQEAIQLNIRCGHLIAVCQSPSEAQQLLVARLETSMAVQVVSDHVKHYPLLERATLRPHAFTPFQEMSGSMGSELGQDAVYHQASSFVQSATQIIDAAEAALKEAGRLPEVPEFFNLPAGEGGSTTMPDAFAKVFESLGSGLSHKTAVQFVITDGEPARQV
jgi:hypothetical protein